MKKPSFLRHPTLLETFTILTGFFICIGDIFTAWATGILALAWSQHHTEEYEEEEE